MNWDQIENNWLAMARRIRPELPLCGIPSVDAVQNAPNRSETATDRNERTVDSSLSAARLIA
ncbi:MAG: hypothetical protein ACK4RN_07260 [Pseudorhodobacter sp.]